MCMCVCVFVCVCVASLLDLQPCRCALQAFLMLTFCVCMCVCMCVCVYVCVSCRWALQEFLSVDRKATPWLIVQFHAAPYVSRTGCPHGMKMGDCMLMRMNGVLHEAKGQGERWEGCCTHTHTHTHTRTHTHMDTETPNFHSPLLSPSPSLPLAPLALLSFLAAFLRGPFQGSRVLHAFLRRPVLHIRSGEREG